MNKENKKKASLLWGVFWSFCKISPITFGGGYAMIPAIEKEIVEQRGWMDAEEMSQALSIAGSAPGGIGVNAATLVGYRLAGLPGAVAAVLGISLPTFIIMLLLTIGYSAVHDAKKVTAAFEGIHAAVVAFIAVAGWRMFKSSVSDKTTLLILLGALAALVFSGWHPAVLLLIGTLVGVMCFKWKQKLGRGLKEGKPDKRDSVVPAAAGPGQYIWGDGI
ncbi:chromate transporter [Paenibacillus doosanensis]|uniref:Chromate transport protein n=1 Tax=Paenibacillus konkukensis TaxID=2020716 RepID=A0ABY4RWB4_9BACL|nr:MULTISPECIES: chromate transporter [Paenibacillus]MCS7458864.1 chromate transporter [Paenibacillus doosanensis]UQZ86607.1 putative chromate transport protein [Paenibacillus konkukensis]